MESKGDAVDLTDKSRLCSAFFEAIPVPAMIISKERIIQAANKAAVEYGVVPGTNCWNTYGKLASISKEAREYFQAHGEAPQGGVMCYFCEAKRALASQAPVTRVEKIGDTLWEIHWTPVGPKEYLHYAFDITGKQTP